MEALKGVLEVVSSRSWMSKSSRGIPFEILCRSAGKETTSRKKCRLVGKLQRRALVVGMQKVAADCAVRRAKLGHLEEGAPESHAASSTVDWSLRTAWTEEMAVACRKKHVHLREVLEAFALVTLRKSQLFSPGLPDVS